MNWWQGICLGSRLRMKQNLTFIGILFGCFGRKIDGPGLPGGLITYQGHLCLHVCFLCILDVGQDQGQGHDSNQKGAGVRPLNRWQRFLLDHFED